MCTLINTIHLSDFLYFSALYAWKLTDYSLDHPHNYCHNDPCSISQTWQIYQYVTALLENYNATYCLALI